MQDFAAARLRMIESQLRTENVTARNVLSAMGTIPREDFVHSDARAFAYMDKGVALNEDGSRCMMRGAALAQLLQLAEVEATDKVLTIGAGLGYGATVLARLAQSVVALESDPDLAAGARAALEKASVTTATVVEGPLEEGHAAGAPYDLILLEGSVELVPDRLFEQLAEGGRLVAVLGRGLAAEATVFTKNEGRIGDRIAFNTDIWPLPGFRKPDMFVF